MRIPSVTVTRTPRTRHEEQVFRQQVHVKAGRADVVLSEFSEEEKIELSLIGSFDGVRTGMHRLLELRKAAYAAHVAAMEVPADITNALGMLASTFGPEVKVWAQRLPWLDAFMVARYGEEPSVWPTAFDAEDEARALRWAIKNAWPHGVERVA